jgi:hypothetical protein
MSKLLMLISCFAWGMNERKRETELGQETIKKTRLEYVQPKDSSPKKPRNFAELGKKRDEELTDLKIVAYKLPE